MLNRVIKCITSLRLTVVCLGLGILLVFLGTLAQVNEGLFNAQARWFRSFFVWWGPQGAGWQIPVLPGGYLVGTVLLVNLIAAHIKRFQKTWKKLGIHITHAGIILLLLGQLATDLLSRETQMSFAEGETRDFSVSSLHSELVFITDAGDAEEVVSIPDRLLARGGEIKHEKLPFTIRVKRYHVNSDVRQRAPMIDKDPPPATAGSGPNVTLLPLPEAKTMDDRNAPAVIFELVGAQGSLGTWLGQLKLRDQEISMGDKTWKMAFRFERHYEPFSVTLLKTTHNVYPGTDIPKDFESRVRINNPAKGERREVDIYMNNPLRYAGLTFYQSRMDRDELDRSRGVSGLMVVRNPGWITPYAG
ncbi:MAG TPA: cytochrome c biogenesis protein ResB, partial [Verrucomicrobiae bacterium]